jgi:hypothetical protein
MFGFLKRLFRGSAPRSAQQAAAPTPAPLAVEPVFEPAAAPEPVAPLADTAPLSFESSFAPAHAPAYAPPHAPAQGGTLDMSALDEDAVPAGMVPVPGVPDAYMIGLVGEEDHAEAVEMLEPGMTIWLQLEPDNPHDSSAIAAVDPYGRVIGYIAQDSWLREAVYGGGASFVAQVLAAETGTRGYREVVLMVEPSELALSERRYQPHA